MKPRLFIASSVETLQIAHAAQENLEHVAEVTAWNQGIFELSRYSLDSLIEAFENTDFGLFVFAATDVTKMRGEEVRTVRDNVVFELGLCIGRLGKERSFLLIPRGKEADFHLPTDLLGITPAVYDADRQDGDMSAALGPACSKISRIVGKLGTIRQAITALPSVADELPAPKYTEGDITAIIASWMGNRPSRKNLEVIHFARVDQELRLPSGSAKRLLEGGRGTVVFRVEASRPEAGLHGLMEAAHEGC